MLEQIIKDSKATSLKAVEEGEVQDAFIWRFIRVTSSIRETMRATGVFGGEVFGTDSYRVLSELPCSIRAPTRRTSSIGGSSIPTTSTPSSPRSDRGIHPLRSAAPLDPGPRCGRWRDGVRGQSEPNTVDGHYGLPHHLFNDFQHDFFGPHTYNYTYWLRRIKKSFDPNGVSEASNHITAK